MKFFFLLKTVLQVLAVIGKKMNFITSTHIQSYLHFFKMSHFILFTFFLFFKSRTLLVLFPTAVLVCNETEGHITLPGGRLTCLPAWLTVFKSSMHTMSSYLFLLGWRLYRTLFYHFLAIPFHSIIYHRRRG